MSDPGQTPQQPEVLYEGRFARLLRAHHWEYVERPRGIGAVAIIAVTDDGRLVLIEQYRILVQRRVIELPAGLVGDAHDVPGETIEAAARRELLEETGYAARQILPLAGGPPSAGLSAELVELVLAEGLTRRASGGGDTSEAITVHEVPVSSVDEWLHAMAAQGCLIDPKIYAGLYLARRLGRSYNVAG